LAAHHKISAAAARPVYTSSHDSSYHAVTSQDQPPCFSVHTAGQYETGRLPVQRDHFEYSDLLSHFVLSLLVNYYRVKLEVNCQRTPKSNK
jgi:hypothetical protein